MKLHAILAFLLMLPAVCAASDPTPSLRHVFDIHAKCAEAFTVGDTPQGKRVIIPITGGEVSGDVKGTIRSGGADYQLVDTVSGRTSLEAIYSFRTDDGAWIKVCNKGIIRPDDKNYYFMTAPTFEAPQGTRYEWLNDRIFVCRPVGFTDGITLRVWVVE